MFDWIIILCSNKNSYKISDECQIWPDPNTYCRVSGKIDTKCCQHSSALMFCWIFFILGSYKNNHNISVEFEFRPDPTSDCGVTLN